MRAELPPLWPNAEVDEGPAGIADGVDPDPKAVEAGAAEDAAAAANGLGDAVDPNADDPNAPPVLVELPPKPNALLLGAAGGAPLDAADSSAALDPSIAAEGADVVLVETGCDVPTDELIAVVGLIIPS